MITNSEKSRDCVKINVVLVNWKGANDTLRCLESLRNCVAPLFLVTVVDNSQNVDGIREICSNFDFVSYHDAGGNVGFAAGCNIGAMIQEDCEYVLLLNNDTEVESNFLAPLLSVMQSDEDIGACSGVIYYGESRDSAWFTSSYIDKLHGNATHSIPTCTGVSMVPWLSGCCMLIRKNLFDRLDGFNGELFTYWEDVDLSLRVRKMGYTLAVVPDSRIYHYVSSSSQKVSKQTTYYYWRNRLWVVRCHSDVFDRNSLIAVVIDLVRHCFRDIRKSFSFNLFCCYLRALVIGLVCWKKCVS